MSSDVRVRVRLGALRLEYEGERTFYESHVERMVEAAARRDLTASAPILDGTTTPRASMPPEAHEPATSAPAGAASTPRVSSPAVNGTSSSVNSTSSSVNSRGARFAPHSSELGKFIRKLGPEAGEPDRQVVALAFYLWNYEKRATFGREELEGCFHAIGMGAPARIDDILHDLTERKRFLEAADSDLWRLSRKGENYVKTRLLAGG